MLLHQTPFDEITEVHLQRLVDVRASESMRLDFKQQLPVPEGRNADPDNHRRFCRDVCAFANADGGDLVFGMREEKGEAVEVNGLICADQEKYKSKLEDILKDHVEPRIVRVRLRFVPLQSGRLALVLRVPRSLEAPHGVRASGAWDFYMRRSSGQYAMSVSEIRTAFARTQDWREGILRWHRARVDMYEAGEGVARVEGDCRVYVHVVPLGWEGELHVADIINHPTFAKPLLRHAQWQCLFPPTPTFDGTLHLSMLNSPNHNPGALALWTHDGRFESAATSVFRPANSNGPRSIQGEWIEDLIHGYIAAGVASLAELKIGGPYLVTAALCGAKGAKVHYGRSGNWPFSAGTGVALRHEQLVLPPVTLDQADDDLWMPLKPMINRLANAGGTASSPRYGNQG